jgi:DNA-directed RNA polymerase specialized sigma subunit
MLTQDDKQAIESQINYAVAKYGGNRPPSLARAEAEMIVHNAMKNYNPKSSGIKTYLSSRLQKMSRKAYKASSPLSIPETRLMGRRKLRDFIDGYKDTHGFAPSVSDIAEGLKVPLNEANRMMSEYGAVRAESLYSDSKERPAILSHEAIIQSLPIEHRNLAEDIFIKELSAPDIMKQHNLKRSTYLGRKKKIVKQLTAISNINNIERR